MSRPAAMGTCPLCGGAIESNQHTAWRVVEGTPQRVHGACLEPPVTRRAVQVPENSSVPRRDGVCFTYGHRGRHQEGASEMQTPTVETITLNDPASPQRGEYVAYLATNKFGKQRAFANEATATRWANR